MCQTKIFFENRPLLSKVTVLLAFCLFAECAAGSCLSYGHACWGAHGKRSGNRPFTMPKESASPQLSPDLPNANWILTKLLQSPMESLQRRYTPRIKEVVIPSQLYLSDVKTNPLKGLQDWQTGADVNQEDDTNFNDLFHTNSDYNFSKEKRSIKN